MNPPVNSRLRKDDEDEFSAIAREVRHFSEKGDGALMVLSETVISYVDCYRYVGQPARNVDWETKVVEKRLKTNGLSFDDIDRILALVRRVAIAIHRHGDDPTDVLRDLRVATYASGQPISDGRKHQFVHFERLVRSSLLTGFVVKRVDWRWKTLATASACGIASGVSVILSAYNVVDLINPGLAFPAMVLSVGTVVLWTIRAFELNRQR